MGSWADNDFCPNCGSTNCPASCYYAPKEYGYTPETERDREDYKLTKKDYLLLLLWVSVILAEIALGIALGHWLGRW